MPYRAKSLTRSRSVAFTRQSGRCFYCGCEMWLCNSQDFCARYSLTPVQAKRFQCTGEHLLAKQDGGGTGQDNIVAACAFCNRTRHKRKKPLEPDAYGAYVRKQLAKRSWHLPWVFKKGLVAPVAR